MNKFFKPILTLIMLMSVINAWADDEQKNPSAFPVGAARLLPRVAHEQETLVQRDPGRRRAGRRTGRTPPGKLPVGKKITVHSNGYFLCFDQSTYRIS